MDEGERPEAMDRFRRWAAYAVGLSVLGWVGYALWRGFNETAGELASFSWGLYVPVLLLTLVNYGLRFFKWHYLLLRLDIRIPVVTNLWIFVTGLAMVISPAKLGEVVKPYLVKVIAGAPMTRTIPALVTERVTDGIAVVLLAAIGVSTFYSEGAALVFASLAVCVAGLVVIAVRPLSMGVIEIIRLLPKVGPPVADRLEHAYLAMRTCLAPVPFVVTMVASLVAWWAECVGFWLVFQGLGADARLDASTFLYAFATVFGAPSPGGMGMADVALAEGSMALVDGLTAGQALAAALLIRLATLWFGVALGAVALLRIDGIIDSRTR